MDKKDIIEFFDRLAPGWDKSMEKSDEVIAKILKNAHLKAGDKVLDVASGTGVMFDYYLSGGAEKIVGVDISPKMTEIAAQKYAAEPRVLVLCADILEAELREKFDLIMVYNAFPHFPDGAALIKRLYDLLKEGGRLCIAHGEGREKIDSRHTGAASKVSLGLMPAEELASLFEPYFDVETVISDDRMYMVSGKLLI